MKLQTLLNRIISRNIVAHGGYRYISTLLSSILFSKESLTGLLPIKINNNFYFNLDDITSGSESRMLGITYHFQQLEIAEEVSGDNLPVNVNSERNYETDFKNALTSANSFRHEFIDHFGDEELIEVKSRTLSFLRILIPEIQNSDLLKYFFNELIAQQISLDFELKSFPEFYEKIRWYQRISPVEGLINIDCNPNS